MLAMSSTSSSSHHQPTNPFLATNLGGGSSSSPWPLQLLEDPFLITTNYHHQHSLLDTHFVNSPPPPLPFIDLPPESFAGEEEQQVTKKDSSSSGGGTVITTIKKLNHNASERHRRKKINTLYSSLRSMLPPTDHHPTKKLSIPNTVSRVLKYIPELQQQVEALERKKKELLSAVSNDKQLDNNKQDGHVDQNPNIILDDDHHHRTNLDTTKKSFTSSSSSTLVSSSSSTVSTSWLGEQEVMVQISIAQNDDKSNVVPHRTFPVSEVLLHLKETGLVLVNSSSFESCRGRIFYNLHLQVEGTHQGVLVGLDREALSEKLLNLYEQAMARSS